MAETVLLVGGGGREHAIARALAGSSATLYACAGNRNPGIAQLAAEVETLATTNPTAVCSYAREVDATLAVIGPEGPLEAGVADALDDAGVYAFGPRQTEARIETDKAFQRRFMDEHSIPGCPAFETFDDAGRACEYIDSHDGDLAVKPAGLTGGKGVKVIGDQVTAAEAKAYIRESGYDRLVLEERLVGEEFTVQALVANGDLRVTPAVQDHKRAYEGDEGPNTGGMGSYTDTGLALPFMNRADYLAAVDIMQATVCKYAVPVGYPTDPEGGARLTIDAERAGDALLYYASVDEREDGIYTTTSRSVAVVGVADSIAAAEEIAQNALDAAGEDGLRSRADIGKPRVVQKRIDHMAELRDG